MALKIYDSLRRDKVLFAPLDPQHVRLYVCGPTVYARAHIGNARPVVVFDVLVRLLRHHYPAVTYVRNITDIDDKIIAASCQQGRSIQSITTETIAFYHEDMAALLAIPPDHEPRATAWVPQMVAMIETLIHNGHAYVAQGHVLFDVTSYADYGRLSRRCPEDMLAGARVEVAPYKKHPGDFVLWKPSTDDQPGWESPWGRGRPGWHIECSAMATEILGPSFDIHGGGCDLIFPHHENERAQSHCTAPDALYANYWMHNGHVTVDAAKMAKSTGNILTVQDLLRTAPGEALRLTLLGTHYTQPLDWTDEAVHQARKALDKFYGALKLMPDLPIDDSALPHPSVLAALNDDLNTPLALMHMHKLAHQAHITSDPLKRGEILATLRSSGALMGILATDPNLWFHEGVSLNPDLHAEIQQLVSARESARTSKNFLEADALRDKLLAMGVAVDDGPQGSTWRWVGMPDAR